MICKNPSFMFHTLITNTKILYMYLFFSPLIISESQKNLQLFLYTKFVSNFVTILYLFFFTAVLLKQSKHEFCTYPKKYKLTLVRQRKQKIMHTYCAIFSQKSRFTR